MINANGSFFRVALSILLAASPYRDCAMQLLVFASAVHTISFRMLSEPLENAIEYGRLRESDKWLWVSCFPVFFRCIFEFRVWAWTQHVVTPNDGTLSSHSMTHSISLITVSVIPSQTYGNSFLHTCDRSR